MVHGETPAILLCNPKFAHNVGTVLRSAVCLGAKQVWLTGSRVSLCDSDYERIPREERMKDYATVPLMHSERPFDHFHPSKVVPVCIEFDGPESLMSFEHPRNALYIFGPEDGNVPQVIKRFCHRFVSIPSQHCLNLATTVTIVLYDRMAKQSR